MNQERNAEAAEEIVLTPEDRERLSMLFAEIANTPFFEYDDASGQRAVALRNALRQEGRKAATYIFERFEHGAVLQNPAPDAPSLFDYIRWLSFCCSPQENKKLGDLLVSDLVYSDPDRSSRGRLLEILQRTGTAENIDHLIRFADKVFGAHRGGPHYSDIYETVKVLCAILERTPDETEKLKIQTGIGQFNEILVKHGVVPYTQAAIDLIRSTVSPQEISERFEQNFAPPRPWSFSPRFDEQEDQEIVRRFENGEFKSAESRLATVKLLRHEARKEKGISEEPEDDDARFLRRHWLEYREKNPSPYAPTLGIEIEIRESTVRPKETEEALTSEQAFLQDERLLEKYRETEKIGVPRGNDKFWEFAHSPVRGYMTLSREVQALIEMGLINKEDRRHPLHLTIGGITSDENQEQIAPYEPSEAYVLARLLEASAWSTTGGRLLRPYLTNRGSWNVKGNGGVNERSPDEIELGVQRAVELRTFQLQSLTGLDRLLRSAFLLGAALKAYQEENRDDAVAQGATEGNRKNLANIWEKFSEEGRKVFLARNLWDPYEEWLHPDPYDSEENRRENPFVPFANLLDEARKDPESRGAEFVATIRKLIIDARANVAALMYPSDSK